MDKIKSWVGRRFTRKPNQFLARLCEQSTFVLYGTDALLQYIEEPSRKNAARVRIYEKKADEVRRTLIIELGNTFITPIDREDLFALSRSIDDILDFAYATIHEIDALNVKPDAYLGQMAALLHTGATEIYHAITQLEREPHLADQHAVKVKALENRMEALYTQAIADLFQCPRDLTEVVHMMKLREIYRHLLHAGQTTEQVADNISDIVMKFY